MEIDAFYIPFQAQSHKLCSLRGVFNVFMAQVDKCSEQMDKKSLKLPEAMKNRFDYPYSCGGRLCSFSLVSPFSRFSLVSLTHPPIHNPKYTGLIELGLKPHFLTDEVLSDMFRVVEKYKDRINKDAIYRGVRW